MLDAYNTMQSLYILCKSIAHFRVSQRLTEGCVQLCRRSLDCIFILMQQILTISHTWSLNRHKLVLIQKWDRLKKAMSATFPLHPLRYHLSAHKPFDYSDTHNVHLNPHVQLKTPLFYSSHGNQSNFHAKKLISLSSPCLGANVLRD